MDLEDERKKGLQDSGLRSSKGRAATKWDGKGFGRNGLILCFRFV